MRLVVLIFYITVTAVWGWILAIRARRRIRKALGINATEVQLTSISTWMKVDEAERQSAENKPITPR